MGGRLSCDRPSFCSTEGLRSPGHPGPVSHHEAEEQTEVHLGMVSTGDEQELDVEERHTQAPEGGKHFLAQLCSCLPRREGHVHVHGGLPCVLGAATLTLLPGYQLPGAMGVVHDGLVLLREFHIRSSPCT